MTGDLSKRFFANSNKKRNRHPGKLHFTTFCCFFFSPEKLRRLFSLTEVNPSPDSKMIKFLAFNNLFPGLRRFR